MAKLKEQMTGRTSVSYKTLYLETKRKLEILQAKSGIEVDEIVSPTPAQFPTEIKGSEEKPEPVEEPKKTQTLIAKSKNSIPEAVSEEAGDKSEEPLKELELVEENIEEEAKTGKVDPNSFDYRCSDCKELFNEEGNVVEEGIKCPDCGKVYPNE